jgi:hypothetical protein
MQSDITIGAYSWLIRPTPVRNGILAFAGRNNRTWMYAEKPGFPSGSRLDEQVAPPQGHLQPLQRAALALTVAQPARPIRVFPCSSVSCCFLEPPAVDASI